LTIGIDARLIGASALIVAWADRRAARP